MRHYAYVHDKTESSTGYYSCEPTPAISLYESMKHVCTSPYDSFMRRHVLMRCAHETAVTLRSCFERLIKAQENIFVLHSLLQELLLVQPQWQEVLSDVLAELALALPAGGARKDTGKHTGGKKHTNENAGENTVGNFGENTAHNVEKDIEKSVKKDTGKDLGKDIENSVEKETFFSPLIFLRWQSLDIIQKDTLLHREWMHVFTENMTGHKKLLPPHEIGLESLQKHLHFSPQFFKGAAPQHNVFTLPFSTNVQAVFNDKNNLLWQTVHKKCASVQKHPRPPAEETATLAEERLNACGIIAGQEMRHMASLSPIALLRPWHMRIAVNEGRNAFTLQGDATTYGRGLSIENARASCLMEMVERASLYFSVADGVVLARSIPTAIIKARFSDLVKDNKKALNPNDFPLEVPYANTPLAWVKGHNTLAESVFVPLQMVGLFCNLDEVDIFDALGSTGIATGNTLAEAKLAALTEIIERDCQSTTPFTKSSCFTLVPEGDAVLERLFALYAQNGLQVQFQDITGALGVPAYKCFVMSPKGKIFQGFGANLNAQKAVMAALTETPFPFSTASGPSLRRLPTVSFATLPNYSLGSAEADLLLLEALLLANNRSPVYMNMAHEALQFPVIRAFVPGMELAADKDTFSRVPLRLYQNYCYQFTQQ